MGDYELDTLRLQQLEPCEDLFEDYFWGNFGQLLAGQFCLGSNRILKYAVALYTAYEVMNGFVADDLWGIFSQKGFTHKQLLF